MYDVLLPPGVNVTAVKYINIRYQYALRRFYSVVSICVYTTAFVSFIANHSMWTQKTICLVTIVTVGRCLESRRRQCFPQNIDCHIFVYPHTATKPHITATKPHNTANFMLHYINSTRSRKLNDACFQFIASCDAHLLLSQKLS
jgi:hypothetical protein